jgi:chromosome segregation ATPase
LLRRGELKPEKVKGDLAMRTHPTAILGLAVLFACLDLGGVSAARGDDVRPAQILKNKGLERQRGSASGWSLGAESDVLWKFRAAKGLFNQLAAAHEAQKNLEMGDQNPRTMIDALQGQINMGDARIAEIDQQLAQLGGAGGNLIVNYHNLLVQERNAIAAEQGRLNTMINNLARQGGGLEQQKREFNAEVRRLGVSYKKAVDEFSKSIDQIQKKYADAGKDADITKALADLSVSTRIKQKLGPSKDLQSGLKWLQRAGGSGSNPEAPAKPRRKR